MSTRSATEIIKGYAYQFDYSIDKLLSLPNDTDEITIEGIEDIDVDSLNESAAIQCKYYAKTEYNHSVIAKPIRLMLDHFKGVKNGINNQIEYKLYGYYESGQNKLSLPIDVDFLKDRFLTYTSKKVAYKHHETLGLNDVEFQEFISLLSIDINAKEYNEQYDNIIIKLSNTFSCDQFDAEYYYYNNAVNEIQKLSIESDLSNRKISKADFIQRINNKQILFNKWFIEIKGKRQYHATIKDKHFRRLNRAPYERFFIIDITPSTSTVEIKEILYFIADKYSNLKKREPQTYCPYIYLNNIESAQFLELKNQIFVEGIKIIDGIPFKGADFSVDYISIKANYNNQIKLKFLNTISEIETCLNNITKTKEVYQFFFNTPILTVVNSSVKNVPIQIENIQNIKEII